MNYDDSFLRRQYLINLFPIMFSILGGTVNALIDSVFISLVLGKDGLSAVTLSMPVYLVLCSIGALIASGGSLLYIHLRNSFFGICVFLQTSFGSSRAGQCVK